MRSARQTNGLGGGAPQRARILLSLPLLMRSCRWVCTLAPPLTLVCTCRCSSILPLLSSSTAIDTQAPAPTASAAATKFSASLQQAVPAGGATSDAEPRALCETALGKQHVASLLVPPPLPEQCWHCKAWPHPHLRVVPGSASAGAAVKALNAACMMERHSAPSRATTAAWAAAPPEEKASASACPPALAELLHSLVPTSCQGRVGGGR